MQAINQENLALTSQQQTILFSEAKLTAFLSQITHGKACFHLSSSGWVLPSSDECCDLSVSPDEKAWVRQASWKMGAVLWVKAKMVIPVSVIESEPSLLTLGDKSFGAMFANRPELVKTKIELHELDGHVQRKTFFSFGENPFLVSEIFLPAFWDFVLNV